MYCFFCGAVKTRLLTDLFFTELSNKQQTAICTAVTAAQIRQSPTTLTFQYPFTVLSVLRLFRLRLYFTLYNFHYYSIWDRTQEFYTLSHNTQDDEQERRRTEEPNQRPETPTDKNSGFI